MLEYDMNLLNSEESYKNKDIETENKKRKKQWLNPTLSYISLAVGIFIAIGRVFPLPNKPNWGSVVFNLVKIFILTYLFVFISGSIIMHTLLAFM